MGTSTLWCGGFSKIQTDKTYRKGVKE